MLVCSVATDTQSHSALFSFSFGPTVAFLFVFRSSEAKCWNDLDKTGGNRTFTIKTEQKHHRISDTFCLTYKACLDMY